jgi:hypothetical protein
MSAKQLVVQLETILAFRDGEDLEVRIPEIVVDGPPFEGTIDYFS